MIERSYQMVFMNICVVVSSMIFILGCIFWLLTLTGITNDYWMYTVLINPIGAILAYPVIKSKQNKYGYVLLVLNLLMTFSFFIYMAFGYWISSLFNLNP